MKTDWTAHWKKTDNRSMSWRFWKWRISRAYEKLLKGIRIKDIKLIELGSGSGSNSLIISKIKKVREIVLVDSNKKALGISKRTFKGSDLKVRFLKKDVMKLKTREKFDIVHSEGLVEHFYGKERE